MMTQAPTNEPLEQAKKEQRRPWYKSLTVWIFIGLLAGIALGYVGFRHDKVFNPDGSLAHDAAGNPVMIAAADRWNVGNNVYFLRDIFLHGIKSIIAPLVFSTLVVGIAGGGNLKKVGRMGTKALVYFEIVTTVALFIGLLVVNVTKPGANVKLSADATTAQQGTAAIAKNKPMTVTETITHAFPDSVVKAMVEGDVLQIVTFAVLFSMAVVAIGERARPVVVLAEAVSQVMFRFTSYVMLFAPIGVGAAMAHTVDAHGLGILSNLGKLIGSLYAALALFIVCVLCPVMLICRIPILKFFRAIREPATIAFATTSSESALPKAMEQMERFGVPSRIVGFVMPTGYSFNLDGSTLYLAIASVFVAQAAEATYGPDAHMPFGRQVLMMLALMLTSKGVAAVPRASMVVLLATIDSFLSHSAPGIGPVAVFIIMGVDEVMDMARTCVNVIGNCLATAVVARWEGEFDDELANAYGTPREIEIAQRRAAAEVPTDARLATVPA